MEIPAFIGEWSAETLIVLVVLLILTDRLVTRGRLLEERAEKLLWQKAHEKQQALSAELTATNAEYSEAALLSKKVMEALQEKNGQEPG